MRSACPAPTPRRFRTATRQFQTPPAGLVGARGPGCGGWGGVGCRVWCRSPRGVGFGRRATPHKGRLLPCPGRWTPVLRPRADVARTAAPAAHAVASWDVMFATAGAVQAVGSRSASRALPRGSGCESSRRWVGIFSIPGRCTMAATLFRSPLPQIGQCREWMSKTCLSCRARPTRCGRA